MRYPRVAGYRLWPTVSVIARDTAWFEAQVELYHSAIRRWACPDYAEEAVAAFDECLRRLLETTQMDVTEALEEKAKNYDDMMKAFLASVLAVGGEVIISRKRQVEMGGSYHLERWDDPDGTIHFKAALARLGGPKE